MGITRGKDMLLKLDDGSGNYRVIGGLRTKSFTLSSAAVDVTTVESKGWRELLSCGGLRQVNISGEGVFINDAASDQAQSLFFSGEHGRWQLVIPDYGTLSGPFQLSSLEYTGPTRGETTFRMSLASAGEITFINGSIA
ncbi:MAG: phage major tail protein, TP901-1 family [Pseudomonadota bacterium]